MVVKIVGLYTIAGLLMALALQEAGSASAKREGPRRDGLVYASMLVGGMMVYSLLVVILVRARLGSAKITHFVLPSLMVAGLVGWRVWTVRSADASLGSGSGDSRTLRGRFSAGWPFQCRSSAFRSS